MTEATTETVTLSEWEAAKERVTEFSGEYKVRNVQDDQQFDLAGVDLKAVHGMRKELEAQRKKVTVPLDTAKKAVMDQAKAVDKPLEQIELSLRRVMGVYTAEQRKKAQEAQAELDRVAREQAEHEALKLAEELEAAGQAEEAEAALAPAVIEQAVQERRMHVSSAPPKTEGVAVLQNWKFEVLDENAIPRQFMTPDMKAIGANVRSLKEKASIAGVRIYSEDGMRVS